MSLNFNVTDNTYTFNSVVGSYSFTANVAGVNNASGSVDVVGASSSTDNAVVRFNGTDGKTIQNSLLSVDDSGNLILPSDTKIYLDGGTNTYLQFNSTSGKVELYVNGNIQANWG